MAVWVITRLRASPWIGRRWTQVRTDEGSPTVETIGWAAFGFFVVLTLGVILRDKIEAIATSLPDSLDW